MTTNNQFSSFGRYDFMKLAPYMCWLSVGTVTLSFVLMFTKGFHFGIDFQGGTEIQAKFASTPDIGKIREIVERVGAAGASVQEFGTQNEVLIRMQQAKGATNSETNKLNQERIAAVTQALKSELQLPDDGIRKVDSVGPQVGDELKKQSILAMLYSFLAILIYVGLRFDFRYAPGAVLCLVHDAVLVLGIFSLLGREVNIQVLAGVLTVIGYSINDTIVIFDSIRSNEPMFKEKGLNFVINKSTNDMLSRTILTGGTVFVSALCLYFFGTGAIEDIAFTMILGSIFGTFSTVYVASALIPLTDKLYKAFS